MSRSMRNALLALVALVGWGCGDGNEGTGPGGSNEDGFTTDRTSYEPYTFARLHLTGATPADATSLPGMLDDTSVDLAVLADSTLVFMVPDVPAGSNSLSFTIGAREIAGTIEVAAATSIADPAGFLSDVGADARAELDALRASIEADTSTAYDRSLALELLAAAEDSLDAFDAARGGASGTDLEQMARAVRGGIESGGAPAMAGAAAAAVTSIPSQCRNEATAFDAYKCTWNDFGVSLKDAGFFLGAAWLASETIPVTGVAGVGVAAVSAAFGLLDAARALRTGLELVRLHGMMAWHLGTSIYESTSEYFRVSESIPAPLATEARIAGVTSQATMESPRDERPLSFTLSPQGRTVVAADRDAPLDWLATGLRYLAAYNAWVGRFGSRFTIPMPTASAQYLPEVPAEQVSIEMVSNPQVRLKSLSRDGTRVTVVFDTDATSAQDFVYDVVYASTVYPTVHIRYEARLEPQGYVLAYPDGTLVGDTIRVFGRIVNYLKVVNDDGSDIPIDLSVQYYLDNFTNPALGVEWGHASAPNDGSGHGLDYRFVPQEGGTTFITDGELRLSDGTNIGTFLQRVTWVVTDSVDFYTSDVPGSYTERWYDLVTGEMTSSWNWTVRADGTVNQRGTDEGVWWVWVEDVAAGQAVRYHLGAEFPDDTPLGYYTDGFDLSHPFVPTPTGQGQGQRGVISRD